RPRRRVRAAGGRVPRDAPPVHGNSRGARAGTRAGRASGIEKRRASMLSSTLPTDLLPKHPAAWRGFNLLAPQLSAPATLLAETAGVQGAGDEIVRTLRTSTEPRDERVDVDRLGRVELDQLAVELERPPLAGVEPPAQLLDDRLV